MTKQTLKSCLLSMSSMLRPSRFASKRLMRVQLPSVHEMTTDGRMVM
jgi:hypothetical protein